MTLKRAFDLAVAVPALIIFFPVLIIIAIVIHRKMGGGIFFLQRRPGLHGTPFNILKFKTMSDAKDKDGNLLPDSQRLTKFGRFLRSSSLDELPELVNVIFGDMSLVGPRPLLMQYLERYTPEQARRHDVLPGITGWAQVNGRNAISWDDKFKLDVWYVENYSIPLDIKILFMTVARVFKREGISQTGHATAEEFKGKKN
ncbi:Sugar transferase involved in LPS biosynthesis (colanic, teichoic acid) [Maridesulfovibrio ferrireducens]|uniref:Sugar transferase involved in LPS biosynthesis (Colanic, teichoic acid) n=1 Tax=Maridesulfovibrio ferrireducens TaxID=246191 RepID=A0A1G9CS48_9BACT|nr:sugar transferase [Maridesulfovibrio ferrireducens]SDK54275.1 Sugar transferase involved in LPS biosynthesis (colanic, teichoic acid) [Maridesulfovibrio ferrireducens]